MKSLVSTDNCSGHYKISNYVFQGDTALLRAAQSARPNIIESILNNVGALDTVEKVSVLPLLLVAVCLLTLSFCAALATQDQPLLHAVLALSTTRASGAPVTEDQVIKSVQLLLGAGANPRCVDQVSTFVFNATENILTPRF